MATTILRSVGGYVFDASLTEAHESELQVTDNPLETGVDASDHAFMKPLKFTLTAGVSDTPLHVTDSDPFGAAGLSARSRTCFQLLQQLQATAEPFTVVSGLRVYDEMMLVKLSTTQDKDTCNALFFTAEFRQVIRVSTQAITYPPRRAGATRRQASATSKKGTQQGAQPDNTKQQTLLLKLKNIYSGIVK